MIKLQIVGNLGKDCIVKEVNGKSVINFSVAHTERFKDSQGNQKDRTTWVECAYWTDKTAVAQYLVKGKTIYAEGTAEAEGYLNKEGLAAATLRMRVQSVQLIGGNTDNQGQNQNQGQVQGQNQGQSYNQNAPQNANSAAPTYNAYSSNSSAPAADDLPF